MSWCRISADATMRAWTNHGAGTLGGQREIWKLGFSEKAARGETHEKQFQLGEFSQFWHQLSSYLLETMPPKSNRCSLDDGSRKIVAVILARWLDPYRNNSNAFAFPRHQTVSSVIWLRTVFVCTLCTMKNSGKFWSKSEGLVCLWNSKCHSCPTNNGRTVHSNTRS